MVELANGVYNVEHNTHPVTALRMVVLSMPIGGLCLLRLGLAFAKFLCFFPVVFQHAEVRPSDLVTHNHEYLGPPSRYCPFGSQVVIFTFAAVHRQR